MSKNNAFDNLVKRIKDHNDKYGNNMSGTDAHKKAAEIAEKSDREKSENKSRGQ